MEKLKTCARLFFELFKISLFVIGGGYAIIVVADDVFSRRGWTKEGELLDNLPVFQMVPGLIATHVAVYVGGKVAGRLGALIGVIAIALPSIAIFTAVAIGYDSLPLDNAHIGSAFIGLRSSITGIIAATLIRNWTKTLKDAFAYMMMIAALVAMAAFGVPIPYVLLVAMAVGIAAEFGRERVKMSRTKFRACWWPLLLFSKYGLLGFGGGFVLVPMYLEDFVGTSAPYLQISMAEFSNVMALSQMTPGPVGINCATFFGYRLAGVAGAILASIALVLPGSLIVYAVLRSLERFRENRLVKGILRGIRPTSVALMLIALWAFASMSIFAIHKNGEISYNLTSIAITILATMIMMKKKLNAMMLIALSALLATALHAEEVTTARFPDADAVTVDENERVEYHPDGTSESVSECWTKILTEKGRREESQVSLHYSKRYGKAAIEYVGVIGADGKEREIDVRATTKEATDNGAMSANIYDPLDRKIVCTVPGLKIGDVVHVKMSRSVVKPRCENMWSDIAVMEWSHPILKSTWQIKAPKERPLKKIAIKRPLGNVTRSERRLDDGSTLYTFVCTNSAQVFPEPDMPPLYTEVQCVHASTAADWPEISRWYWNLCLPHMSRTTPEMTNTVKAIVAKAGADRDRRIRAIFKFVSQEIRYMGLTMEDTAPGYAPHDVDVTFNNRYGVCRDKAGLLAALLRVAGFQAFPVLIHAGAKLYAEVPQPFFNHAIVAVDTGKCEYMLMDPTNESTKDIFPSYLCDKSYLVARPEGDTLRTSPVPPPEHNSLDIAAKAKLDKDGSMFYECAIDFSGINDTAYRQAFVKMKGEDRAKFLTRILKAVVPGAELVKGEVEPTDMRDTDRPIKVKIAATLPEMVLRGVTGDELVVPYLGRIFGIANFLLRGNTSLEKRKYPLVIDSTARVSETIDIDLGTAVDKPRVLPPKVATRGGYDYTRTFESAPGHLKSQRNLVISKVELDPAEYQQVRESIKAAEASERRRPQFAKNPLADADARYALESTEVDIVSDTCWTVTNAVVKEVLTYEGKKKSAELKLGYNPAVGSIEVVSAVVSNKDGRIYSVSPREMNVMDCSWAASAPRYPASKLLIVNLPSVEIGSVISVVTAKIVTNAPASYYGSFGFDSTEPLECRRVRINGLTREVKNPRRLPNEPGQPTAYLWRDTLTFTTNDFRKAAERLADAIEVDAVEPPETSLEGIRNWMAKYVKLAGPSLYELPLDRQLTDPRTVLAERYASRLDYIRTLCALLRGAGYDADVVFAADDADEMELARNRIKYEYPNVRAFASALCRVKVTSGGFLGFGADEKVYFIGTENEYTPLGATAFEGADYFDPATAEFGLVTVPDDALRDRTSETDRILVRDNGAVDMTVENLTWGVGVGGFRKTYAEILPEDRSRLYQSILGGIAQAATATGDLEADIKSYPARRSFSCFIPDYATVAGDTITLQLPALLSSIPTFTGKTRQTPFAIGAADDEVEIVTVRFPDGYTKIEHLPEPFSFGVPNSAFGKWQYSVVSSKVVDNSLEVMLMRAVIRRTASWYAADYIELVNDRNRIANSRANRTIVVRKK